MTALQKPQDGGSTIGHGAEQGTLPPQARLALAPAPSVGPNGDIARQKPQEAKAASGLELLLKIEAEARRVGDAEELSFLIANETMKLARARQIFVLTAKDSRKFSVTQVSSVSQFDRKSERIEWVEAIVKGLQKELGLNTQREFDLPAYTPAKDTQHVTYPFKNMLWVPFLRRDGGAFAGLLIARDTPWGETDKVVTKRLGETYAHAWLALSKSAFPVSRRRVRPFIWMSLLLAGLVAAGFYPVPLTVLAPLEVTSATLKTVAAPLDGVVETILVDVNTPVKAGDPVIRMSDTSLRNDAAIASGEYDKSRAHLKRVMQSAINDPTMLREIAIARSDVAVAKARQDYATELLGRATVLAPAAGVAVFTDKRDWTGRPVQTGERVMDIADPTATEFRIFIPVQDSIAVQDGSRVKVFLDSDPLHPVEAVVTSSSYEARPQPNGVLAYQVTARFADGTEPSVRLGVHGTGQVYSSDVPLAFFLFRKPFSVIRQWLGM